MIRRDYILRNLEEFGRALARLRSFLRGKDYEAFEREIREISSQFTGQALEQVLGMSESEFRKNYPMNDTLIYEEKKMIAQLLYEQLMYLLEREEQEKAAGLLQKCLLMYETLIEESGDQYDLESNYRLKALRELSDQLM